MHIETGLIDHMVLQRAAGDACDVSFTGKADADGVVEARVEKGGKAVRGLSWHDVGKAAKGKVTGRLKGVAAGGPYDVRLRVRDGKKTVDEVTVKDVLVGDVWVLAGQSNMQGCGNRKDAAKPDPMVRALYMHDEWGGAKEPIHNLHNAVDPVHGGSPDAKDPGLKGVGPGVMFGKRMLEHTGVPQGLLCCAHGGTSMSQWDPALKKQGGGSLYGASVRRFNKHGGRIAGVIWYQGESDAFGEAAPLYTDRMKKLIRAFRRDMKDPSSRGAGGELPFVLVQLSRFTGEGWEPRWWNSIQDQQRRLEGSVKRCAAVPAIDLQLDDQIHVGGRGQQTLGVRLADAAAGMSRRATGQAAKPPIALGKVKVVADKNSGLAALEVSFENVAGKLHSGGARPVGFTIIDAGPVPCIYDTELKGAKALLHTVHPPSYFGDKSLHYGYGLDPVCNIQDEAGRSLPVFGPLAMGEPRALTPFVTELRVSPPMPSQDDLTTLKHPKSLAPLKLKPRQFETMLLNVNEQLTHYDGDCVVYFACRLHCPQPMKLAALLGYDGPVKLWIDGKQKLHDPAGTNPALADEGTVNFNATAGDHDVLVALGSNFGNAWGIMLRFERLNLTKRELKEGPTHYEMPTVSAE